MSPSHKNLIAFIFCLLINGCLLWHFHDRFWWPADEGNLAYMAERLLLGDVLSKDFHQLHSGYINFVNAAALKLFGKNLVSFRYPLVLISLIQSILLFFLFISRGRTMAVLASSIPTTMGILQYLNPNQHWYCLFLVIGLVCGVTWIKNDKLRYFIVGFLVISIYLFRQLSGVLVAMGALSYLLYSHQEKRAVGQNYLPRGLMGVMFLGLLFYLKQMTDFTGFLIIGIWPTIILGWMILTNNTSNKKTLQILSAFIIGGCVALLPTIFYHIAHDSLSFWMNDTMLRAVSMIDIDYLNLLNYQILMNGVFHSLSTAENSAQVLNGFYWIVLLVIYLFAGYYTVLTLMRQEKNEKNKNIFLAFISVFYAVVSLHNQIPIYLYHTVGLSLLGILWIISVQSYRKSILFMVLSIWLCLMSVYYHAGQPLSRGLIGYIKGKKTEVVPSHGRLKFVDLWIEEKDIVKYSQLISLIQRESNQADEILVLPYNPEIYFLSERRNPFRFVWFELGVKNSQEIKYVFSRLIDNPPRLIVYDPNNKRNTRFSRSLMDYVKRQYSLMQTIDDFEIYKSN